MPFYYEREARIAGETKYPISKMLKFASTAMLYFLRSKSVAFGDESRVYIRIGRYNLGGLVHVGQVYGLVTPRLAGLLS